jgi:hypothetical protein
MMVHWIDSVLEGLDAAEESSGEAAQGTGH